MSSVKDLIDKALRGVESASSESEEDIASAVPTWGSPARDEPVERVHSSRARIRRAHGARGGERRGGGRERDDG